MHQVYFALALCAAMFAVANASTTVCGQFYNGAACSGTPETRCAELNSCVTGITPISCVEGQAQISLHSNAACDEAVFTNTTLPEDECVEYTEGVMVTMSCSTTSSPAELMGCNTTSQKVVASNTGASFGGPVAEDEDGAMIKPSTVGGACDADAVVDCTFGDEGCLSVEACNNTDNEHCWKCEAAEIVPFDEHKAQIEVYADCVSIFVGTRLIRRATEEEQKELLVSLKQVIIDDCNLEGCRYATEYEAVTFPDKWSDRDKLFFNSKSRQDKRKLNRCSSAHQPHFTQDGCRWSLSPLQPVG
eukprot:m.294812 g.294812  ORF g.294812 m.294812 type:complete len:303 (+) comp50331_c0_seq1:274-1182(+)